MLGPVIHAWPLVGIALKVAVVAYLVVIAVRLWRHGNSLTDEKARIDVPAVFVTALLNPKALIFALSIIPAEHPALWAYIAAFAIAVPACGPLLDPPRARRGCRGGRAARRHRAQDRVGRAGRIRRCDRGFRAGLTGPHTSVSLP